MQTSLEYEHIEIRPGMPVEVIGIGEGKQHGKAISGELYDHVGNAYYKVMVGAEIHECDKWQVFPFRLATNKDRLNVLKLVR